jgi:Tol biopolymer transport system component
MSTRKEKSMRRVFLIGALVACAVVAWAGKGVGGKPPKEDPEFTVAYKDNSISGRAWVMTATGSTRQSVTGFLVWSGTNWTPDGTSLLVTSEVDGLGIYAVDIATKARTKLVAVSDRWNSPDWSVSATPNGRQMIAFSDDVVAGGPSNNEAVFVAETDGTGVHQLTSTETGRIWDHPRFHPSGDSIAVSTSAPGSQLRGVVLLHLGTAAAGTLVVTGTTNLTNIEGSPFQGVGGLGLIFQFSNDGTLGVLSTGTDIWLMDLEDPANPTNLTQGAGGSQPGSPCFDAADEKIYFVAHLSSRKGGTWRTFRMNVDGTGLEQITNQKAGTTSGVSCKKA